MIIGLTYLLVKLIGMCSFQFFLYSLHTKIPKILKILRSTRSRYGTLSSPTTNIKPKLVIVFIYIDKDDCKEVIVFIYIDEDDCEEELHPQQERGSTTPPVFPCHLTL
jgi:hypothetical protein